MLVYKFLRGQAPSYLSEFVERFQLFQAIHSCGLAPPAFFMSEEQRRQRTKNKEVTHFFSRSFAVTGPVTWNSLPPKLKTVYSVFCQTFEDFLVQVLLFIIKTIKLILCDNHHF